MFSRVREKVDREEEEKARQLAHQEAAERKRKELEELERQAEEREKKLKEEQERLACEKAAKEAEMKRLQEVLIQCIGFMSDVEAFKVGPTLLLKSNYVLTNYCCWSVSVGSILFSRKLIY